MKLFERFKLLFGNQPKIGFDIIKNKNDNAKHNILILTEHINATYYISFDYPLKALYQKGLVNYAVASQKFIVSYSGNFYKDSICSFNPDIVVMTRYGDPSGLDLIKDYKKNNIPVIYHIDDDLLDVPTSLGDEIKKRQGNKAIVETRHKLLNQSDLIFTSTAYLEQELKRVFPNKNFFYGVHSPYIKITNSPKILRTSGEIIIGFMGSKGHVNDLDFVVPAIERLLDERDHLAFEVFGTIQLPEKLKRFGERVRAYQVEKSYSEFLSKLKSLEWSIGLGPLENNKFNRSKSATKFIEYTACNTAMIASKVPAYEALIPYDCALLVENDWYSAIMELLDNKTKREQILVAAKNYCNSIHALDIIENQLIKVFSRVKN